MEAVVLFMSVKQLEWEGRWQARRQRWCREVSMPSVSYCMFMATDIDHMLRGRQRLLD